MKKSFFVLATLALSGVAAHAQDPKPLSVSRVPVRADAPVLFAPRGWKIEKQIGGDLNRDKVSDAVLVLVESTPAKDAEGDVTARQRALVVLLREGKGWRRVGFNGELLLGTRDGGAFYGMVETPVTVGVTRAGIIVKMEAGSREVTNTTHRFRYDAAKKGVFLIGADSATNDRLTADVTSVSCNYLTGVKRTSVTKGKSGKKITTTGKVSKTLRSLDSLNERSRVVS